MQNKIPPYSAPSKSANDNGPLSSGQVKALKFAIAIMGFLIFAALLAIIGRVIYLSAVKKKSAAPTATIAKSLSPKQMLALPAGAVVKNMSLHNDRLLVHYTTTAGPGAAILDLATGQTLSQITITTEK